MTTPRNTHTPIVPFSRKKTNIEKKALEFGFYINTISFNYHGLYYLKLGVHSLYTGDYSDIQVSVRDKKNHLHESEIVTEMTKELAADELYTPDIKQYYFYLPIGFCKNDSKHDVYLLLQAYKVNPKTAKGELFGEVKLGIYPKADTEIDYNVRFGEPMYTFDSQISLLRTETQDQLHMHCGTIVYKAVLRETTPHDDDLPSEASDTERSHRPSIISTRTSLPPIPPIRVTSPRVTSPQQQNDPPRDNQDTADRFNDQYPRITPRGAMPTRVAEDGPQRYPGGNEDDVNGQKWNLLAPEGHEEVSIYLHGGTGLWAKVGEGIVPTRAYVAGKTKFDEDSKFQAQDSTQPSMKATPNPSWEQVINVKYNAKKILDEVIVLTVGDAETRQTIVEFRLPVHKLIPFHHYHLDMAMPSLTDTSTDAHVFATVVRKQATLPAPPSEHPYVALKVMLREMQTSLDNPMSALMAVASVVTDFPNYKYSGTYTRTIDIKSTLTNFPDPHHSTFDLPKHSVHGQPQIALPGRPIGKPSWNFPFLFCHPQELSTLFTRGAAVIIEYYYLEDYFAKEGMEWPTDSPIGYSVIPLDQRSFQILSSNPHGMKVEVPIQGYMKTTKQHYPYVTLVLQLIKDKKFLETDDSVNYDQLPDLVYGPKPFDEVTRPGDAAANQASMSGGGATNEIGPPGRQRKKLLLRDDEFPPEDALERILPDYQYIMQDGGSRAIPAPSQNPAPMPSRPALPAPSQAVIAQQPYSQASIAPAAGAVTYIDTTHQHSQPMNRNISIEAASTEEVERYRGAVKKMSGDILAMRDRVRELEGLNSNLRRNMGGYNEASKILLDSMDLDSLSKQELASRYVALKQKMTGMGSEVSNYKTKVQRLQNELIKKNEMSRGYADVQMAHQTQNSALQKMQEKLSKIQKLEDTVKTQQDLIAKMEDKMSRLKENVRRPLPAVPEVSEQLADENRRLKQEIEDLKSKRKSRAGLDDLERLELFQVLEKAEGRITSLEKQLLENARKWGREKENLLLRARERELAVLSPDPFNSHPVTPSFPRVKTHRRQGKADQRY